MTADKLIEQARKLIEKGDGFYKEAAAKIVSALDAGASQQEVADALGRSRNWVRVLVAWHTSGHSSATPFSREARPGNDRHQVKHSLKNMTPEERGKVVAEAVAEDTEVAKAVAAHPVASARVGVATADKKRKANERVRARNFEEEQDNQGLAVIRVGSRVTEIKAELRMLVMAFQEGVAANPGDEELRQVLVDMVLALKGDVVVAIDTLVGDGVEAALAQILQWEESK